VLATVDLNDHALLKENKIKNVISEGYLSAEFQAGEVSSSQQSPHRCFRISQRMPQSSRILALMRQYRLMFLRL
jgi:hypothetical protein